MRKAIFLTRTLILVFVLSGCDVWFPGVFATDFYFRNRSSQVVDVQITEQADTRRLTLQPGATERVRAVGHQDDLAYTYTPSDVVETGNAGEGYYYFWDKGKPRPY